MPTTTLCQSCQRTYTHNCEECGYVYESRDSLRARIRALRSEQDGLDRKVQDLRSLSANLTHAVDALSREKAQLEAELSVLVQHHAAVRAGLIPSTLTQDGSVTIQWAPVSTEHGNALTRRLEAKKRIVGRVRPIAELRKCTQMSFVDDEGGDV